MEKRQNIALHLLHELYPELDRSIRFGIKQVLPKAKGIWIFPFFSKLTRDDVEAQGSQTKCLSRFSVHCPVS